jgi:hypothetical protein
MGHRGESALVRIQPTRSLPTIPRLPAAQANTPQSSTGAVSTGQGPGSGRHTLWRGWGLPCLYGCTLSASATPVLPLPAAPVSSCRPSSLPCSNQCTTGPQRGQVTTTVCTPRGGVPSLSVLRDTTRGQRPNLGPPVARERTRVDAKATRRRAERCDGGHLPCDSGRASTGWMRAEA